jgi:hypothetical protein
MKTMTSVAAGTWTVDLAHTRAAFRARHLFGRTVHGTIAVTAATIDVGTDGRPRRLHATLDPASIDTGHARRDSDLCGKRFLAVDAYPAMEVVADRIAATADGWYAYAMLRVRGCQGAAPHRCHPGKRRCASPAGKRLGAAGPARCPHPGAGLPSPPVRRPVRYGSSHAARMLRLALR